MFHSVSGLGSWVIQDLFYKLHLPDLEQGSEAQTLRLRDTLIPQVSAPSVLPARNLFSVVNKYAN